MSIEIIKSDRSTEITTELCTLYPKFEGIMKSGLAYAIRMGELLTEQKSILGRGDFVPYLKTLPFSVRLAQDFMKFYRRRDELKNANVAFLTDARKLLSPAKKKIVFENDVYFKTTMSIRDIEPNPFFSMDKLIPPAITWWVNVLTRDDGFGLGLYWITAIRQVGDRHQNICDHDRYYAIQKVGIKDVPVHIVKKMPDKSMKKTLELFDYRRHQEYRQSLRWGLEDDN
ncbi:MAG: hypothetical protein HQ580_04960 [Planctomycetes bacterium]|nr:hypothetical protein [Planctomycetota bacterium]